ncbi:FAD-dependent oxidoreductase [Actinophytocola sp.]|uniref:oxidoreductase n=1 Tax=Actinophytocola sp. TaxID=1872138 RepID=UPI003D6A9269
MPENSYPRLLSPVRLRGLEVRNRMVMTAHRKGLDMPRSPGPREIAYLAARAAGGTALMITEASPVHPTSFPHGDMTTPYSGESIELYRAAAQAVHEQGAAIFGQVYHCGAEATNGVYSERPLWAPSELRGLGSEEVAHAMTLGEVDELVTAFAQGAANFVAAGFDGVEIHGGHGYLIEQFLSPLTNHRTDRHGGSLVNRMRFAREVIEAVRSAVGPDVPVGLRVSADERLPRGLGVSDMVRICAALTSSGEVDYLSVSNGTHESYAGLVPNAAADFGEYARYAGAIKPHVPVPVLAVGRLHTPAAAERVLADGHADLVGMLRALIADPELPNKVAAGEEETIRPCIAVNYCLRRVHLSAEIRCAVNPATGLESVERPPADPSRVAVVGAGPAGLEAACVAAERGHSVVLYEKSDRLGGMFATAGAFPNKIGSARLLDHYRTRLDRLGVDVRLGTAVHDVTELGSVDAVVVATGAASLRSPWPDRHERHGEPWPHPLAFRDDWSALLAQPLRGKRIVLVESEMVDYVAATLIGYLVDSGADLTVVTAADRVGAGLDRPSADAVHRALARADAPAYTGSRLEATGESLEVHSGPLRRVFPLDGVEQVLITGPRRSAVPAGLSPDGGGGTLVRLAGDCLAPRGLPQAIKDGHDRAVRIGVRSPLAHV